MPDQEHRRPADVIRRVCSRIREHCRLGLCGPRPGRRCSPEGFRRLVRGCSNFRLVLSPDVDQQACLDGLRAALLESGLRTQSAFARALGLKRSVMSDYLSGHRTPSATTYLRIVRVGRSLREASMRPMRGDGTWSAPSAAREIAVRLDEGHPEQALLVVSASRGILREVLADEPELRGAWEAAPGTTEDRAWDALLAAVTAIEFTSARLTPPRWVDVADHVIEFDWWLSGIGLREDEVRAGTPRWLALRGLYVDELEIGG